jgi:hypothetical protein
MMPNEFRQAREGFDRRFLLGFGFSLGEDVKIFHELTTAKMKETK